MQRKSSSAPPSKTKDGATDKDNPSPDRKKALSDARRLAIQATVAMLLALLAGRLISPMRWYWSAISAFVVFNSAATFGESLSRAWHRVIGTLVGIFTGLLVAMILSGHSDVEIGLIFLCIFLGYYLFRVAYSWMIFFITIMLALFYNIMGMLTFDLLYLRLLLTFVGCAIGVLVAGAVMPSYTGRKVRDLFNGVLRDVSGLLSSLLEDQNSSRQSWVAEIRRVDKSAQELRQAASPLFNRLVTIRRSRLAQTTREVAVLTYCTRHLIAESEAFPVDHWPEPVKSHLAQVSTNLKAMADGQWEVVALPDYAEQPESSYVTVMPSAPQERLERWVWRMERAVRNTYVYVSLR